jgi:hypothetical protein
MSDQVVEGTVSSVQDLRVGDTGSVDCLRLLFVSQSLTSLAPQPPHKGADGCRFPWSQPSDHIFRNEGVTGSNPVSSTDFPLY